MDFDEYGIRYANGPEGRARHVEDVRASPSGYRCVMCDEDMVTTTSNDGSARFQHQADTPCTGRFPCESVFDLVAELGDRPWWISFDADWREGSWTVRVVRLTRTEEGYLADAPAVRGARSIILTGIHDPDPGCAIASIRLLLSDITRRLRNSKNFNAECPHLKKRGEKQPRV